MQNINYRQIFESSPLPIFILQGENFLLVNKKMELFTGFSASELLKLPFYKLIHPDDREKVTKDTRLLLSGKKAPEEYDFCVIDKFKRTYYVRGNFTLITIEEKPAMLGQVIDISEKVVAEKALKKSQERYRMVVDNAYEAIIVAQDGFIKFFNPKALDIIGHTEEKLLTSSFLEFIHPEHRDMVIERHFKRIRGESFPQRYPFKILNSSNATKWVDMNVVKINWEGRPATLCFMNDITENKLLEEKLTLQQAYFQQLFENTPNGIAILDEQDRIIDINRAFETLFQYKSSELKGRQINDCIVPGHLPPEAEELSNSVLNGKVITKETVRKRKDGSVFNVHILGFPIVAGDKQIGIFAIYSDITVRKRFEADLRASQRSLSTLLSNLPGMAYRCTNNSDRVMEYISEGCYDLTGYHAEELKLMPFNRLIHVQDREKVWNRVQKALAMSKPYRNEYRIITKSGEEKWVWEQGRGVHHGERDTLVLEGFITDISAYKNTEKALMESEARFRELANSLPEIVFEMDLNSKITYVNKNAFILFGVNPEIFEQGIYAIDWVYPKDRPKILKNLAKKLKGEKFQDHEYTFVRKDGSLFPVQIHSNPIIQDGKPLGLRGFIIDISERKQAEEQLKFISLHDSLTALFNRAYFEQEMQRLKNRRFYPVSIIVCDVDGLKIVNDTLGHSSGDQLLIAAASLIKGVFREGDMVARIGGDEFAILLPLSDEVATSQMCRRIQDAIARYNKNHPELPLSISVGYATSSVQTDMQDLFKEADNNMYREKLHRRKSARSAIVQTMMKALKERDFITEGHADRLQDLVVGLALSAGLSEKNMADLRLFAQFHDIGKVGIPDRILFKKGKLNNEEKKEIQKHCEIGYRIALSAPDLTPIANWILSHHEWWNGSGYPNGIKGKDIPVECRILAIADAFDAMTSDRPYRKAIPVEEALKELANCMETQFDPELVRLFIEYINKTFYKDQIH